MSEVKRYVFAHVTLGKTCPCNLEESPAGGLCLYSDYESLQATNAKLVEALEAIRRTVSWYNFPPQEGPPKADGLLNHVDFQAREALEAAKEVK